MVEECTIVTTREGYTVDSCTGEVIDFEAYDSIDYSGLEYYERVSSKREKSTKEVKDTKKVVLNYLLSIMTDKEKEEFYRILNEIEKHRKADAALYLAIYEYVLEREGKTISRDYINFIKARGIGTYSIRQRKKILRQMLKDDPVVIYIYNEYSGNKEEAMVVYRLLKEYGLINGKAKKRKEILMEYLNNKELKKKLLERYYVESLVKLDVWNSNSTNFIGFFV
ncbi:hypothetical protein [Saccharolobus shibatae]|uniref:Conserved conjugative plasmid protein n=1 Tax=Saccharolobus shibatae TaxID=2286 RepID=A0A8F5GUX5_9CREN|nr:hypothetical protein [Saccharolobus shibatae]QXJ30347.1 Conserved conjugative plasmid protein [Saccharolobus shibatae]QXJ30449.1 Conserved conjugative plasmid protein [Saccharolobus shibatae]